ncbi:glycosyltransferase involved in cell wall biosynthesis [Microbacterium sp. SLBN-146]|nr:glycosyltransferase involved in cell wall biosynthesis [Microbacterium sp. SLBN-146]
MVNRLMTSDVQDDARGEISRLRVLHVLDSSGLGGAQRVAMTLVEWLRDLGVDTAVVAPDGAILDGAGDLRQFPSKGRPGFGEISAAIDAFRPTVLHAHQRREALVAGIAGRMRGIPTVEHAHTVLPGHRHRGLSFRSRRIYAVSPDVARMVVDDYRASAERVRVIPNIGAVPVATEAPGPSYRLVLPDVPWEILGIGRMTEQKNPLRFVSVVARLNRIRPVHARWIGEGPLLSPARRLAAVLGAPVDFVGRSVQIAEELDGVDALLMTSEWEGLPLAALEAYARGRVVFATESSRVPAPEALRARYIVDDGTTDEDFARRIADTLSVADGVASDSVAVHADAARRADLDGLFAPILADYRDLSSRGRV